MKRTFLYLVAMLAFATSADAQGWFHKPTPNDTLRSTVIMPDNSVIFQLYAPDAESVAVIAGLPGVRISMIWPRDCSIRNFDSSI